jgi:hypothetical protein
MSLGVARSCPLLALGLALDLDPLPWWQVVGAAGRR